MLATWPPAAQPIFQDPNMVRQMTIASLNSCQSVGYILCNQEIGFLKEWSTRCVFFLPNIRANITQSGQGPKLTFLGRHQLATEIWKSWKNVVAKKCQ